MSDIFFLEDGSAIDIADEVMNEAGGIVSFLARAYTGKDRDLPDAIRKELSEIKTDTQKKAKLDEIDHFIKEAEATAFNAYVKFPPELKPNEVAMPGSDLFRKRLAYMKKKNHNNHGQIQRALAQSVTPPIFGPLISSIVTLVNVKDGTMDKYIKELKKVRSEIVALKVSK